MRCSCSQHPSQSARYEWVFPSLHLFRRDTGGDRDPRKGVAVGVRDVPVSTHRYAVIASLSVQELCESRGGRPGLQVPNCQHGLCGRKATLNSNLLRAQELRKCGGGHPGLPVPNSPYGLSLTLPLHQSVSPKSINSTDKDKTLKPTTEPVIFIRIYPTCYQHNRTGTPVTASLFQRTAQRNNFAFPVTAQQNDNFAFFCDSTTGRQLRFSS